MTKPNVTPEEMEERVIDIWGTSKNMEEFGKRLIATPERKLSQDALLTELDYLEMKCGRSSATDAIRALIADYPKLKAKYDALKGRAGKWKRVAKHAFDYNREKEAWDLVIRILAQEKEE
jgi:phage shock protein A